MCRWVGQGDARGMTRERKGTLIQSLVYAGPRDKLYKWIILFNSHYIWQLKKLNLGEVVPEKKKQSNLRWLTPELTKNNLMNGHDWYISKRNWRSEQHLDPWESTRPIWIPIRWVWSLLATVIPSPVLWISSFQHQVKPPCPNPTPSVLFLHTVVCRCC